MTLRKRIKFGYLACSMKIYIEKEINVSKQSQLILKKKRKNNDFSPLEFRSIYKANFMVHPIYLSVPIHSFFKLITKLVVFLKINIFFITYNYNN